MQIITTITEMENWSKQFRCENPGKKIGLIPTMGFLHEGHLSLMRQAAQQSDKLVVSIFVNPIQFNNPEDLKNYPRDAERDIILLNEIGGDVHIDILFMPGSDEVYKNGFPEIFLDYPGLTNKLCGKTRPGHFSGMLTIVHNLFVWVKPHIAVFGLKDYQQYILIKKMNNDLGMGVDVLPGSIVREKDGLAMSSRNSRLTPDERISALAIPKALFAVKDKYLLGEHNIENLKTMLSERLKNFHNDYASLYNPDTLEEIESGDHPRQILVAIATHVGKVRLIDNIILSG